MKTAITSSGDSPESTLDQRFGRCAYFVIYDPQSGGMEILPNPYQDSLEGAGPAAVQFLAARDVKKIVSGEFGIKIKSLLDSLKIQMIILQDPHKTVREVLAMLQQNPTP